eukprot:s1408_g2.t1
MSKWQNRSSGGEEPWYCVNCRIMRKASAGHCDRCGQSWAEASDPDFVYNSGQRTSSRHRNAYYDTGQSTRSNQQWVQQPRRPSRRRGHGNNAQQRQPSQRGNKGQGRGQGKGPGHRTDASQQITLPAPQQDPPWTMTAPVMPMMPAPPPPPSVGSQPNPQTAELIAAISKNPDGCSPEVQAAFHALQARNAQKESKILHSAVTHLTKAKQELADAQLHRSNLHSSWIKFLQDSTAKWQECGQQFRDQEEAAVTRIKAAQTLYTTACDTLNRTKKEAGVTNAEEVVDVEEMDLTGVSNVNSAKISDSLANLQTSLKELHQSAEELAAQESHTAKRPRTEQNTSPDGLPSFAGSNPPQAKSPAMEPFGMPGQHLPNVHNTRSKCFTPPSILLRSNHKRGVPTLRFPQFVQFADQIEVKICDDLLSHVQEFCCSSASFQNWAFKPWSLYPRSEHPCLPVQPPEDFSPSLPQHLGTGSFEKQTVPHVPLTESALCDPLSEEAVSISRQSSSPMCASDSSKTDGRIEDHSNSFFSSILTDLKVDHIGSACHYQAESIMQSAWSLNAFFAIDHAENEKPHDVGDQSPDGSQPPGDSASSSGNVGHSSRPSVPEVPPFAREVSAAFAQRLRSYVPTDVSGPWIRVWYIHLEYHVRSYFARHVQLRGPPHTWREQVVTLWQDVMLPDVESSIDIVTPTPPREAHEVELVCDVILAQGIGGRHVAGLVTARPMDPSAGPRPYSGAVAFGAAVSKDNFISGLALDQTCRQRQCLVRHGRTVFSQTALHQMQPGYGFLIDVGHPRSVAAGAALIVDSQFDRFPHTYPTAHHTKPDVEDVVVQANSNKSKLPLEPIQLQLHSVSPHNADDPLSTEAVSISHCRCPFPMTISALGAKMKGISNFGIFQTKLTDSTEPNGEYPDRTPESLRPVTPQNAPIQPVVLPAFIHDMFLDLPEEFLDANIFQRGFLVRTWYVHHCTIRRSRVSRCIHLRGPPTTWQAQILTVWFDVLIPHEAVTIDVVKPRPPRSRHETRLAFDLILSQGLELDRYAGLITVNPSVHNPQVPRYAMAVSFPPETNGQMIVDFIAFQQICRRFQCFIVHRWDQLPISPLPIHVMQPGDGFVVGVFTRIPEPDDVQAPSAPSGSEPPQQVQGPATMQCDTPEDDDGSEESSSQRDAASSRDEFRDATDSLRRHVHLYRLGQSVVSAIVSWPLPNDFISVVAPLLGVAHWDIMALYPVQVTPEGTSPLDLSFIVHVVNDLPLGTSDQLLLCDVRVHQHGPSGTGIAPIVQDRRVSVLPIALQREQILQHAHLADYCQFVRNRCLVKLNGLLWPFQDVAFRPVSHGAYVQIVVPPPRTTETHVLRAIQIVEDFGFTQVGDGVADQYPDWGLPSLDSPTSRDGDADTGPVDDPSVHVRQNSAKYVGSVSAFDQHPIFLLEHANDEQTYEPPAFEHNVGTLPIQPAPLQAPLPPMPDLQTFLSTFSVTVERFAEEEFEGQGPVVQIVTWYIHHGRYPECVDKCVSIEGSLPNHDQFDRLIIYTDGSSKAHERRQPPLKVADQGIPDAWAYVVLGEQYATSSHQGSITFLGWQTQQVMYETDNRAFTATDQIGAEFAEREALLFAGLWRLALNSTIPTIFRTDSSTTADQAAGRAGFANLHPTHELLRGTFQALQAGMSPDTMLVEHVRGHAGDVWNELVDFLAKTEASIGHHLKRQDIDLVVLRPCIPYMWMLIACDAGLPLLTAHGFAAIPPQLPPINHPDTTSAGSSATISRLGKFALSLATLNVGSLSVGPDGFGGKLSYLRHQMLAHGLNILGVQEARSPPGLSMMDQVLRISGGSDHGNFGVELWISLRQPYVYIAGKAIHFARSDFQLLHHDPRRLLVRLACAHLSGFFMVLHARQSGRPHQEREQWWSDTNDLAYKYCRNFPLFVLMDANAKTGRCCEPIVFQQDDVESSSTPFLREFLINQELCLPSTSEVHTTEHSTWIAPNGLDEHRIDFVAIPQTLLPKCSWSSTVPSLDPGHAHVDHIAVAIQLVWQEQCSYTKPKHVSCRHDRRAIRAKCTTIDFSTIHVSRWQDDIEAHVTSLNSSLHVALARACPITPAGPKKPFIDDATWALRTEKLQLRRRIKSAARHRSFDCLAYVFRAWSSLSNSLSVAVVLDEAWNHQTAVLCSELCLVSRYWTVSRKLRKSLQLARNSSLTQAIHDVGPEAAAGTILHTLRPFIGPTNPKKHKRACLPIVRHQNGTLCQTPQEAQNRWIAHFGDMEGGMRMSHEEYRNHWRAGLSAFMDRASANVQVQELPSLFDLEVAFRRVPSGKALGLDEIPPELCHHCPAQLAKATYAVLMKAVLFGQEAMEHTGGKLAVAWKQKGDVRDCHTHRSLLVSSHLGKTVHRALRQKYNHLYNAYMQRQQLGGRPCMPVAVPLHMTRAFLRWQHRRKHPTALVFLDLTEAFYRMLRPLAVGGEMSDECIGQMCRRLNLAPETMHELALLLSQPSALSEAGAPAHVQLLLQALHRDTWFQMGTQTDLVRTEVGSRPGDSFADVVFGYLWAKILKGVEDTLVRHEVLESIVDLALPTPYEYVNPSSLSNIPLLGPTWMDDLNIVLTAPSNAALVSKTQFALSVLIDTCKQHHMEPNLKKGKTEVMFTFCGSHSRAYRRQYYSQVPGLPVVCDTSTFQIAVVSRYLHLGGVIHHRDATNQEIQRRLAIAHQNYQQHRRILYHNCALPWTTRCDLFQTLVLSKLMYGVESWTFSTQQCRNRFHAGVMKLYRKLLGGTVSTHMTDLEVLVKTNLPDPNELLHRARLRYFGTLHRCRHQAHWGLLQEDHDWIELLQADLFWLWCQLDGTSELQDPREHFPQWQDLIVHHGRYWKKLVRRGIRHACLQRKKEFHAIELHDRIGRLLLDESWISHIPQHLTVAVPSDPTQAFGCMSCQMSFASYAGESVHMCRSHGRIARERFLFDATHCPSCLKEYHTHSKVLAHLRHSRHCKDTLISRRMHCQPVPGMGSIHDHTLQANIDGALPFQQAHGPHLAPLPMRPEDAHDIVFLEAFCMFLLDVSSEVQLLEACRQFIMSYPISWTACCRTLTHMKETVTADDVEPFAFSRADLLEVLSTLSQHACWPFLANDNRRPVKIQHATLYEWEIWCSDLAECPPPQWSTLQPLPQTLTRYKIILHAFAGRRRRGDIEWFIDSLSHKCSGFTILTVSLDIIIDPHHGDISKAEVRVFWLQYIRRGYVAGFIAGPPCNTWSRARAVKLSDRPGPRIIRTPSEPWGLQTLRLGELEQILLGTVLLGFSLECLLALALHSGSGLIEHPRASDDEQAVSIWKLPIVHLLLQIPQIRLIHLAQGMFGAPSPKPTSLLVLRLPELEKCLHGGMIARDLPFGLTTGRDSSGNFNTAPLKEYPPGLCRAIAEGFVKDFSNLGISVDHDAFEALPKEFFDLCQHMRDRSFGDFIGKD